MTMSPDIVAPTGVSRYPRGLPTLFLTEMWERFSYYGMRALLVLYMTQSLSFPDAKALRIYGYYTSAAYFLPLLGGWLADRFLGSKRAVVVGGTIIACGHFALALAPRPCFYVGLMMVAVGTGLLKPNVSTMVGELYAGDDPRRDAGFSVFYMGINLGAFVAPLVCGYLGQRVNWHYGFAAAGVGMVLGLFQFVFSGDRLKHIGERNTETTRPNVARTQSRLTADEIRRVMVIGVLFFFSIVFWMAFEQSGSSLALFAERLTRNSPFGYQFPSTWLQSVQPVCLLLLAPVFAQLWLRLGDRQPTSPGKFTVGLLFVGLGFALLVYASIQTGTGHVSPFWLIGLYLLHTIGELCLSPVGLSTVTRLAPARMVGLMMGVWFLSISVGSFLAGNVASFFDDSSVAALVRLFGFLTVVPIGAATVLAVLTPTIDRFLRRGAETPARTLRPATASRAK